MEEQLGIIKDIHIGNRDVGRPVLWFTVDILQGSSLQVLSGEEMISFIENSNCYKLEDLEGKPVICEVGKRTVKFKEFK